MYLQRKRPDTPGVLQSCIKQRQNTVTCGARGLKCKTQNDKCTILYTPADPAVAEDANEIDSEATQPTLRRMNASSDLSEYAAEYRQSVESQCGKDAGAADSPDSAEHIWDFGSSNNSGDESEDNRNYWTYWLADQFRRVSIAIEEGHSFVTEYVSEDDDGNELCHRRYYMESREVTKDCFELEHTGCFAVYGIGGQHRGKCNTDTAVAGD